MRLSRDFVKRSHNLPAERGFIAEGTARMDGKVWTFRGWGRTPSEARLELLWQMGRRRFSPDHRHVGKPI